MYEQYKGKPKNLTKICGKCDKPCETAWCVTLENPDEFQDYEENQKNKKEEKASKK